MLDKVLTHLNFEPFIQYEPTMDENNKINGIVVKNVNLIGMTETIFEYVDPKNNLNKPMIKQQFDFLDEEQKKLLVKEMMITRYCIHRILTHFKIYKPWHHTNDTIYLSKDIRDKKMTKENQIDAKKVTSPNSQDHFLIWNYHLDQDYYGEEVSRITLNANVARKLSTSLMNLQHKNSTERIEQVLKLEYNYVLPSIKGKKWSIKVVSKGDLYFSNKKHYEKCVEELNLEENHNYSESVLELKYPRGIVAQIEEHKYKVIDGYHRLAGSGSEKPPLVIYYDRTQVF